MPWLVTVLKGKSGLNHTIIESLGLEGTYSSNHPAMDRGATHWTRFLRVPSNLALNPSRMGHPQLLLATCASASLSFE